MTDSPDPFLRRAREALSTPPPEDVASVLVFDAEWAEWLAALLRQQDAESREDERSITIRRFMAMTPYAPFFDEVPDIETAVEHLRWHKAGWQMAHDPATCGHARANWKDPKYGTSDYPSETTCEFCEGLLKTRTRTLEEVRGLAIGAIGEQVIEAVEVDSLLAALKVSSGEEKPAHPPMVKLKRDHGPLVGR